MEQRNSLSQLIGRWCQEAVEKWGDDWSRISEHIRMRFEELDDAERNKLTDEAAATLHDSTNFPQFLKH